MYDQIKKQIKFTTGRQPITCPSCGKQAIAAVAGAKKDRGKAYRDVTTRCKCGTSYSFRWR